MYPSIGLFYPKLARAVLEYRVRTVDGAKDNAEKQGYKVVDEAIHVTVHYRAHDVVSGSQGLYCIPVCIFFMYLL